MAIIITLVSIYFAWKIIKFFISRSLNKKHQRESLERKIQRKQYLLEKYGDTEIVNMIMERVF